MAKKKTLKCSKCKRSFSMAAHLARHLSSTHASPKKKAAAKRKRAAKKRAPAKKRKTRAKRTRKAKRAKKRSVGRPKGITSRLGLRSMALEQLSEVIAAARAEARRKLSEIQKAMK